MTSTTLQYHEFIIVGAGISGISSALALRRAGLHDFLILESAQSCGGVWRENTYPGIACDIPSIVYQFASDKNPDWSQLYAEGAEIKRYLEHIQIKHQLDRHTRYRTRVNEARYDSASAQWTIHIENGHRYQCRYLIKATGAFNSPLIPNIKGLADFKGRLFHTVRWPKDLDLTGKRVAVIGTGSSSIQLVPEIAKIVSELAVYQRTPIWLLPKPDFTISPVVRHFFRRFPRIYSWCHRCTYDLIAYFLQVVLSASGKHPRAHRFLEAAGRWNIRRQLKDQALVAKFIPHYNLGCKRPSFSNNYYQTFARANVRLMTEAIEGITAQGIRTRGKSADDCFDIIILATGFNILGAASNSLPAFPVIGRGGLSLREYWHSIDGFKAFRGAAVSGFPNLFLNLGIPYAGGTSWFETADLISEHIVKCVTTARSRACQEVEVKSAAVDAYMEEMDQLLAHSVHHTGSCQSANSYYYDKDGRTPLYSGEPPKRSWQWVYTSPEKSYDFRTNGAAV